ncbi:acetate kinase [Halomonas cupida]|uniref:Acetate kinase n=1 Tax=Halomonas cupida TaxID=44933 RepID=A0A1M7C290_9GAMM|nr:acetate kinase [Halomonas cupida]GEN24717.1 acetate kinase [Halomonas cupida]SHL61331.1 acetate kinase [Halomonas cupida]
MNGSILVVNCGSSSIKFALVPQQSGQPRLSGLVERLGASDPGLKFTDENGNKHQFPLPGADHASAMQAILEHLGDRQPRAIGHRVVHGGERFKSATLINEEVIDSIKQCASLAPLHNPANLEGIRATRLLFPDLPQVAVFDTAFHQTMPEHAYRYAIPTELYREHGIRRYGFHGTSHAYIAERLGELSVHGHGGWIIAHLGNGCSATAVWQGRSLDTSMGMTPLEGLVMGTRSGDVDPGLHLHLANQCGWSVEQIDQMLNKHSGLMGLSGLSPDMRDLEQAAGDGHSGARLALDVFCYRLARTMAALSCALPQLDGIAFTGGIGENSPLIRSRALSMMAALGPRLSDIANDNLARGREGRIDLASDTGSPEIWVIPTDEEGRIARETAELVEFQPYLDFHPEASA